MTSCSVFKCIFFSSSSSLSLSAYLHMDISNKILLARDFSPHQEVISSKIFHLILPSSSNSDALDASVKDCFLPGSREITTAPDILVNPDLHH